MVTALSEDTRLVICDNCKKVLLFNKEDESEIKVIPPSFSELNEDEAITVKSVIVCPSCGDIVEVATYMKPWRVI